MKNQALLIGGFMAAALALLVAGIVLLGGSQLFKGHMAAVVNFQDGVAGLYKGAPVTFRGVPVGQVDSIGLEVDPSTGNVRIPVHIRLSEDVVTFRTAGRTVSPLTDLRSAVRAGLRAKLVLQSIVTGQKSIELNILPNQDRVVVSAAVPIEIPVVAGNFAALEDQLADLPVRKIAQELLATLQSLRNTLADANTTLVAAGTTIEGAGRELGGVSREARVTLATADAALRSVQGHAELTLSAATRLADNASGTVTALQPDLVRTVSATREAAETARAALAQVARLTDPAGSLGSNLQGAVADLAEAARGLRDWSDLLDERPNALVFGRRQSDKSPP